MRPIEQILADALSTLAEHERQSVLGSCWIKARELAADGADEAAMIRSIRNHARYMLAVERAETNHPELSESMATTDNAADAIDLADADRLTRTAVAMILAGHTMEDARKRLKVSHRKLTARLQAAVTRMQREAAA